MPEASVPDVSRFRERLPPFPDAAPDRRGRGTLLVRYEDVTQDGRLGARPMSHAIGAAIWRGVLDTHPLATRLIGQGILPILTRLVVCAGGGPIGVRAPVEARGAFELVESLDDGGKSRFRVDMWADVTSVRSQTFGPPPSDSAEPLAIGAVWAEHVLTRPFGPPAERTVDRLPDGLEVTRRVDHVAPPQAIELPEGARWVDDTWIDDPTPLALGLGHTDSNQHVNSLIYPQLLEDAALRLLAANAIPTDRFVGRFEMAYRKPSFAGDVLRVRVRRYAREGDDVIGVMGVFATVAEHAEAQGRARVFGSVELSR